LALAFMHDTYEAIEFNRTLPYSMIKNEAR